jgi:hypothetical protein
MALSAMLRSGETNSFRPDEGEAAVDLVPSGTDFLSIDATETLRYQLDPDWRLTQTASGRQLATETGPASARVPIDGREVGASVGGDRAWKKDGLGATVGVDYIVLTEPGRTSHQIDASLEAAWRRDLSEHWTWMLRAGLTSIFPILDQEGDPQRASVHTPTVAGTLAWFPTWGSLRLDAQRVVAVNMFLAQNTIADELTLSAWLPIPYFVDDPLAPIFTTSAGVGGRRSQLVDLAADERESAYSYSADLALHYAPPRAPYGVSLRYTFFHQTQDAGVAEPAFAEYTRNTVLLEVHGRWPAAQAATYPQRDPLRVDGSDITPMAAEEAAAEPPRQ